MCVRDLLGVKFIFSFAEPLPASWLRQGRCCLRRKAVSRNQRCRERDRHCGWAATFSFGWPLGEPRSKRFDLSADFSIRSDHPGGCRVLRCHRRSACNGIDCLATNDCWVRMCKWLDDSMGTWGSLAAVSGLCPRDLSVEVAELDPKALGIHRSGLRTVSISGW